MYNITAQQWRGAKKIKIMFYIAYFNEETQMSDKLTFDELEDALQYAKTNGYEKVRGWNGAEYFV